MAVSGIGSSYTCIYHASTGKLSSKDGDSDEFIRYYNGELDEEDSKELNGFDRSRKGGLESLFWAFQESGIMGDRKIFDASHGDEFEITHKTVDALTDEFYVNGEKVWTQMTGLRYAPEEVKKFATLGCSFKTHQHKPYDAKTNSINLAVGDVFDLGNGYRLRVLEDSVWCEGFRRDGGEEDRKLSRLGGQLTSLIHFADQQYLADTIYAGYGDTESILDFLRGLGVDTDREFTINGTRCEVKDGRIREVGSRDGIPSSVFNKALKRYEEWLYQPLSSGKSYDLES